MSPSKMRRTQWFREGESAFHMGEPRDSNPYTADPAWKDRNASWLMGWDEASAAEEAAKPTPLEEALAHGDLEGAVSLLDVDDDLKAVLSRMLERLP